MITIHHLGVSQSDRIVWLMEELNLPYELTWYDRGEDFLAPAEYRALEQRLGESEYLGGPNFSCADIMSAFNLTSLAMMGAREIDDSLPNTKAYVERVTARPAYRKAMEIAGPAASR